MASWQQHRIPRKPKPSFVEVHICRRRRKRRREAADTEHKSKRKVQSPQNQQTEDEEEGEDDDEALKEDLPGEDDDEALKEDLPEEEGENANKGGEEEPWWTWRDVHGVGKRGGEWELVGWWEVWRRKSAPKW